MQKQQCNSLTSRCQRFGIGSGGFHPLYARNFVEGLPPLGKIRGRRVTVGESITLRLLL